MDQRSTVTSKQKNLKRCFFLLSLQLLFHVTTRLQHRKLIYDLLIYEVVLQLHMAPFIHFAKKYSVSV